jgi:heme-degrading monooxygenase HmoA
MFVDTPEPPYTAVIFSSQLADDTGYGEISDRMAHLSQQQEGYLGIESARDGRGFGITVSYWRTPQDAANWKKVGQHLLAQKLGKSTFYANYKVRIASVDREYSKSNSAS